MLDKAFVFDPTDRERPVHFGFSPEEREYLRKERTVEEIMAFIKENDLDFLVMEAKFNNDIGFGWFPAQGEIIRGEDGCVFRMDAWQEDGYVDLYIGTMTDEEWADYLRHRKDARFAVTVVRDDNDNDRERVSVLVSTDRNADEYAGPLDDAVTENLIRYAGINTYHRLGKVINRARQIANREREEREKYHLPGRIYPRNVTAGGFGR